MQINGLVAEINNMTSNCQQTVNDIQQQHSSELLKYQGKIHYINKEN
jgi:hypothetical protein